ncbi:2-oxoglutarate dehydrogenase, E2 component, dihydrolipoamide succinyltransferase, partial [Streptomyces chitinivorans]
MTEYPTPRQSAARPMGGGARTAAPAPERTAGRADAAHAALPDPRDEPDASDLAAAAPRDAPAPPQAPA